MKSQALFYDQGIWEGMKENCEVYKLDTLNELEYINQVQSVCFLDKKHIVFYKNIKGFLGNPGGSVEKDESISDTLTRELIEEAQLRLINFVTIGYEKVTYPNKELADKYFLRVASHIELIDKAINDPAGKAIGRIVVPVENAIKTLDWGKKGEVLINLALEKLDQLFTN